MGFSVGVLETIEDVIGSIVVETDVSTVAGIVGKLIFFKDEVKVAEEDVDIAVSVIGF